MTTIVINHNGKGLVQIPALAYYYQVIMVSSYRGKNSAKRNN
jgi:hypothetical protein